MLESWKCLEADTNVKQFFLAVIMGKIPFDSFVFVFEGKSILIWDIQIVYLWTWKRVWYFFSVKMEIKQSNYFLAAIFFVYSILTSISSFELSSLVLRQAFKLLSSITYLACWTTKLRWRTCVVVCFSWPLDHLFWNHFSRKVKIGG